MWLIYKYEMEFIIVAIGGSMHINVYEYAIITNI